MNWCRICRKEAASSSLVNNFGPTPAVNTHLCPTHLEEWNNSSECKRFLSKTEETGCFVAFTDFVSRTISEEAVIAERNKRELLERKNRDEKLAAEKNAATHAALAVK